MLRDLARKLTKHFEFKHTAKLVTIGGQEAGSGSAHLAEVQLIAHLDWGRLQYAHVAEVELRAHLERPRI